MERSRDWMDQAEGDLKHAQSDTMESIINKMSDGGILVLSEGPPPSL
jgi:hypothetical protein